MEEAYVELVELLGADGRSLTSIEKSGEDYYSVNHGAPTSYCNVCHREHLYCYTLMFAVFEKVVPSERQSAQLS